MLTPRDRESAKRAARLVSRPRQGGLGTKRSISTGFLYWTKDAPRSRIGFPRQSLAGGEPHDLEHLALRVAVVVSGGGWHYWPSCSTRTRCAASLPSPAGGTRFGSRGSLCHCS